MPSLKPHLRHKNENYYAFVTRLQECYPETATIERLNRLWRIAKWLKDYGVNECNREVSEKETERNTKSEQEAIAIAKEIGVPMSLMSDPRGYSLKFHLPTDRWNSMGGREEGWGISGYEDHRDED